MSGDIKKLTVAVRSPDVLPLDSSDCTRITVTGRAAWALNNLINAGERGCTPIDTPGPRWSDYVFKLRKAGVAVETIDEKHGGPYSGEHARYVLRSPLTVLEEVRA